MFKVYLALISLLTFAPVYAHKRVYNTKRVENNALHIDGIINDHAWNSVDWSGDFSQREPYASQPASESTQFKILYNNNTLYIAIRCFDSSPDSIVQRMSRRDGEEGDLVKIIIDSYHDLQSGFSFGVSAAGVKIDEAITLSVSRDASWNPVWEVKTLIDTEGWTIEAAIPLTQLRFSKKETHTWGLQIERVINRKAETSVWQYIPPTAAGYIQLMGELHGISDIKPHKQKEITPYMAGGLKNYEPDSENPFAPGTEYIKNAGLDAKFGITNDLTLDLSINPDFGQVEADPSEVNLTTFETKFDEKRPFFIEGKKMLSYRILRGGGPLSSDDLFYSRRIGRSPAYTPATTDTEYIQIPQTTNILGAAKLTGKTRKGWSIGILESITQHEYAEIDRSGERRLETAEPLTNYFASRIEKDLNSGNTHISAMITATNRNFDNDIIADNMHHEAYSGGIDFMHEWKDRTYYVHVSTALSSVQGTPQTLLNTQTSAPHYLQRPNTAHLNVDSSRTSLEGYGGTFQIGRAGNGKWMYTFWVTMRSPGLDLNDMGYIHRNDEIQQIAWAEYREFQPKGVFRKYQIDFNQWYASTFGGETRYYGGNVSTDLTFRNYMKIGAYITREGPAISTEILRGGPKLSYEGIWFGGIFFNTDDRKKIMLSTFPFIEKRDQKTLLTKGIEFSMRYQMSDALNVSVNPKYNHYNNESEWVQQPDTISNERYVMGRIQQKTISVTLRASYNITPDFTVELYAMPFISAGEYSNFRYVNNPSARKFNQRFIDYTEQQVGYNSSSNVYSIDENLDSTPELYFDNPNFNRFDFNSNLVIRWEFKPGSTAYLVWSQNRFKDHHSGIFNLTKDTQTLFKETYPTDVFLIKFSYRFGL